MGSFNIRRVEKRFNEMFDGKIDLSDLKKERDPDKVKNCFNSRALAAVSLMMKCGLDETQSALHITDGYHDFGIDAIYLDETQKTLFIVQSKWRSNGEGSINQNEMNAFVNGIKRIINFELDGANPKITNKKEDIERGLIGVGYKIEAVFIHTGNGEVNDFIMRPMVELTNIVNDDAGDILHFQLMTFKEIYDYLAAAGVAIDITIDDVVMNNWGKVTEPYFCYYGVINATAIGEWYSRYGNKLFTQNLRFYKGRTDVNDGIKKVLINEPQNFIYYNNGIKLLCRKITRKAMASTTSDTGIFRLEGVSLINGAQTTGSIGGVFAEDPEKLRNVKVIVQMIDMSGMSDDVGRSITKLSNTQNRIENKDYAAQDSTQERIKRELSFSHIQYLYKTGEEITDSSTQISFDEAIVALACLWSDVSYAITAKRNVGILSDDITKTPYKALFNPSTNAFELLNAVFIVREIERMLQTIKASATGKQYATCVHANRLIEHVVLQEIRKDRTFSEVQISIPEVSKQIQDLLNMIIPAISKELDTTYIDSYPANVFKNQTKSKEIAGVVKETIETQQGK